MPFLKASLQFKNFKFLDAYFPFPINLWEVMGGSFDSWVDFKAKDPDFFEKMSSQSILITEGFVEHPLVYADLINFKLSSLEDHLYKDFIFFLLDTIEAIEGDFLNTKDFEGNPLKKLKGSFFLDKYKK